MTSKPMTSIQACLNMLKNLPDSKAEIRRVKILIACHEWTEERDIAEKANLANLIGNGALMLRDLGLLERKQELKQYDTKKQPVYLYKTTPKGIELLTKMMK